MPERPQRGCLGGLLACLLAFMAWAGTPEGSAGQRIAELEAELARQPGQIGLMIELARLHHNEATRDVQAAPVHTARARELLDRLLQQEPGHAFGRALLGSTVVLTAREAFWPATKIRRVKDGLALMDAALRDTPGDHNARFTRACNNLFLPDLFERRRVVELDFQWLQERVDQGQFEPDFRQYVCLFHGRAHAKWGGWDQAVSLWEQGLKVDPQSKVADELRAELTQARLKSRR